MALTITQFTGFGTVIITDGTATTVTQVPLGAVASQGDVVSLFFNGLNGSTNSPTFTLWKDSGGTEAYHIATDVSNNVIGDHGRVTGQATVVLTAAHGNQVFYSWSAAPSIGADIYAQAVISGFTVI